MFPWAAFVFAGGCIGVLLDGARTPVAESHLNKWLAGAGLVLATIAYAGSFLPIHTHTRNSGVIPRRSLRFALVSLPQ
jgi:hypothetical protein